MRVDCQLLWSLVSLKI